LVDLDGDVLQYVKHRLLPVNGKYVVFSDHHLFVEGDPLDRFRQIGNHELYMAVLHYYAQNGYTLIENGDVEDLWMRPMSFSSAAEDITLEVIGWPIGTAIEEAREETRITNQARDIFTNNADVYFTIDSRFHSNGRFVRIWGNHDDYWSQSKYVDELQAVYTNLQPVEYAIITDSSGPAEVLIAHGHQIDAWNNATCRVAGELITESVSGIPSLAASVEEREDWESKLSDGFDNELSNIDLPGSSISENEFYEKTKEEFSDRRDMPEFVLGHSHTPREDALIENWQYEDEWTFNEYTNEGTAGRWEEFVWCAYIVNGQVGLKGFYINGNNQIVMQSFRGAGSATGILERVGNAQIIA
jgi:hypothetical protein